MIRDALGWCLFVGLMTYVMILITQTWMSL